MLFKKTPLFRETSLESVRLEKHVNLSDCTLVYNFLAIPLSNNDVLFSDNTHIHCHCSMSQIKKKNSEANELDRQLPVISYVGQNRVNIQTNMLTDNYTYSS